MVAPPVEIQQLIRQHKDQAAAHILEGRPGQALACYRQVLELSPQDTPSRLKVAELLAQLGHRREAVREFHSLALRYAAEGQTLHAIAACKLLLVLEPQHRETQETLAALITLQQTRERPPPREEPSSPSSPPSGPLPPSATPLFSQLPREVFVALLGLLEVRQVPAGEVLIAQGTQGHSMFVLVQGQVRVEHASEAAPPRTLAELGEGCFFGEMGLVSDAPRLASAVALSECTLLEVTRGMLSRLTERYPSLEHVVRRFYQERLLDNLLRSHPVFQALPEANKRALLPLFQTRSVEPGQVLLQQGQRSHALHLLLRGRCAVVHEERQGDGPAYPDMTEGAVFGEISLLLDLRITATVRALTPCLLLVLGHEAVKQWVLPHPEVRRSLTQLSRERLERTASLLADGAQVRDSFLL